jgi:integrase
MGSTALKRDAAARNSQYQAGKGRPVPPTGLARVCGIDGEVNCLSTVVESDSLPQMLKAKGRTMSRHRYQRPEVYLWTGKSGDKLWKAEWRQYVEGRPKPKHRSATWPYAYTKTKAQEACDRLVREETGGTLRPDGSMTVTEFWEQVYFPTVKLRIAENTEAMYRSWWKNFVRTAIGGTELQHVTKAAIDAILNRMATAGKAEGSIARVLSLMHGLFVEAVENGYIIRNPAHRVTVPRAKPAQQTRALSETEAQRLFTLPIDRGTLMFRTMLMTGARIGEVLALTKDDLTPGGLVIDESALRGRASTTKNRKTRCVPLPPLLHGELDRWGASQPGRLLFPNSNGNMDRRASDAMRTILRDVRTAAGIPDLTPRMCRTTFATLFQSDPRDIQDILGHSTVDLTMEVYRRPITSRQVAAVEELEARLRGKVVTMKPMEKAG